ncbi:hypothetical protein AK812_SmicGene40303 [Symbiodinium microadriaticum]|uniref:Uncharacterized protein n=1 Tax=Symbiodinium microadriaticum TaxID=2951 RepID=A0A1Q9C8Z2_SYMMI|nr:hypothetical protein AK812_SmicGene40303 [Symbiodinium microadriaticum]
MRTSARPSAERSTLRASALRLVNLLSSRLGKHEPRSRSSCTAPKRVRTRSKRAKTSKTNAGVQQRGKEVQPKCRGFGSRLRPAEGGWVRDLTEEGIEPHPGPSASMATSLRYLAWSCQGHFNLMHLQETNLNPRLQREIAHVAEVKGFHDVPKGTDALGRERLGFKQGELWNLEASAALLRVDEVIVAQQAADKMDGIHRWQRALADRGSAEEERRVPCDHAAALRRWQRHGISRQAVINALNQAGIQAYRAMRASGQVEELMSSETGLAAWASLRADIPRPSTRKPETSKSAFKDNVDAHLGPTGKVDRETCRAMCAERTGCYELGPRVENRCELRLGTNYGFSLDFMGRVPTPISCVGSLKYLRPGVETGVESESILQPIPAFLLRWMNVTHHEDLFEHNTIYNDIKVSHPSFSHLDQGCESMVRRHTEAATTVVKQSSQASGKKAGLCIWLRFIEGLSDL